MFISVYNKRPSFRMGVSLAESQGFSCIASQSTGLVSPFCRLQPARCEISHRDISLTLAPFRVRIPFFISVYNKRPSFRTGVSLAESQGFEPWVLLRTQHFECCTIDHSDNSPNSTKLFKSADNLFIIPHSYRLFKSEFFRSSFSVYITKRLSRLYISKGYFLRYSQVILSYCERLLQKKNP